MADITLLIALVYLVTGALLGSAFGSAMKRRGFGRLGNCFMGILGACLGGLIATVGNIVIDNNFITNFLAAAAGVTLFSLLVAIFKRG